MAHVMMKMAREPARRLTTMTAITAKNCNSALGPTYHISGTQLAATLLPGGDMHIEGTMRRPGIQSSPSSFKTHEG